MYQATLTKITNYTFTPVPIFIIYGTYSDMKSLIHDQKLELLHDFFLNLYNYENFDLFDSQRRNPLC
jgi:hypothetical protein